MSIFDAYETASHAQRVLAFVGMSRRQFLDRYALPGDRSEKGRFLIKDRLLAVLHDLANKKAGQADAVVTSFAERFKLALSYSSHNYFSLGKQLRVSRETVRCWAGGRQPKPIILAQIAAALCVPESWLRNGNPLDLPPDSQVGVRVGQAAMACREELYDQLMAALPDDLTAEDLPDFLERIVWLDIELSRLARHAGGRWVYVGESLHFAPWSPLPDKLPTRQLWSAQVEEIIAAKLANHPSVYGAYKAIKTECLALGLPHPQKITLYKRADRARSRILKFGITQATKR